MAGMSPLEHLTQRQGEFDGLTLYGHMFKLRNESRKGWYITSAPKIGNVKHYWVEHGEFYTVISHIATPPHGATYLDIGDVTRVKEVEKATIARAVEEWTREYHEKLLSEPL
jgi:hypothetical protein